MTALIRKLFLSTLCLLPASASFAVDLKIQFGAARKWEWKTNLKPGDVEFNPLLELKLAAGQLKMGGDVAGNGDVIDPDFPVDLRFVCKSLPGAEQKRKLYVLHQVDSDNRAYIVDALTQEALVVLSYDEGLSYVNLEEEPVLLLSTEMQIGTSTLHLARWALGEFLICNAL